ncbi:MAG TPA: hypothetical protein VKS24_24755 [Bradyrhizobium sp.]|nr:hypothetical protein [Bradyrhizobium sp.]
MTPRDEHGRFTRAGRANVGLRVRETPCRHRKFTRNQIALIVVLALMSAAFGMIVGAALETYMVGVCRDKNSFFNGDKS